MHNKRYEIYNENVNKKKIQTYWDEYAAREDWQEGCSGLSQDIRWIDYVCEDYDAAYKYIENHDRGWYDQLAIKFKEYPELKYSKKYETLLNRLKEIQKRLDDLENKIHYARVTSKFVGCKKCGSKIASAYIKSNYCPICRLDLRPTTILEKIKGYKEKISQLKKELEEEKHKMKKKIEKQATIKWLVKIEYHT